MLGTTPKMALSFSCPSLYSLPIHLPFLSLLGLPISVPTTYVIPPQLSILFLLPREFHPFLLVLYSLPSLCGYMDSMSFLYGNRLLSLLPLCVFYKELDEEVEGELGIKPMSAHRPGLEFEEECRKSVLTQLFCFVVFLIIVAK